MARKFIPTMCSTAGAAMLLCFFSTGCRNHDKPTEAPPVKVDVQVAGSATAAAGGSAYSGTVEAADASTVSFSVPGTITRMAVGVGDRVAKGQVLATVRSESLRNASEIALAELAEARDAYNRLKKLHDANALPDIKWVEAQQTLKQAENAAAIAERGVQDATLRSPLAGYVAEKLADEGQTVIASQPVLRVVSLNDMRVVIAVPENGIDAMREGMKARVVFDGLDSLGVDARLVQKAVVADPLTRSYAVKFAVANPSGRILPGMIGNVTIENTDVNVSPADGTSVVLPSQTVLLDADNRSFVWIVDKDGRAERRFVQADELEGTGVRVTSGLAAGDSVIVAGMQKVGTGTLVTTE